MFYYEITETERHQIMSAMEWAMWGIKENLAADYLTPETRQSIEDEKQDLVRLWDHINMMLPSRSHATTDDVKAECDALFRKGQ